MKKLLLLLFMLILSISASSKVKYHPKTKDELKELIENERFKYVESTKDN